MLQRQLLAELFGTFCLVFTIAGANVVNDVSGGTVTYLGINLLTGLCVLSIIYAIGDISGAHINPAVTLGFLAAGKFPARLVAPYIISQFAGALLASTVLRLLYPEASTMGGTIPSGPHWQSFGMEVILTLILMFVILNVSTGAKEKGITAGIAVGAVVSFESIMGGAISGASMNPARSAGPALVSLELGTLWIYLVAPVAGALLAVILHKLMRIDP